MQPTWNLTSSSVELIDGTVLAKASSASVYTSSSGEPVAVQMFYGDEVVSIPWHQIKAIRSA